MGKIANLKKTAYYLKRNGLRKTYYAVLERLADKRPYSYEEISENEWARQREASADWSVKISVLVPTYRTKEEYLREMIDSLLNQSYPNWELVLADATEDDSVKSVADTYADSRIVYVKLQSNVGISDNTNQGLAHVSGDYVGLLDHDDVLTPDALFEMAQMITAAQTAGMENALQMLYSDEDKCNGDRTAYYEPNFKEDFNLDMLLTNNYICHFLVMKKELIQELKFRPAYDGAQDFDLVLRAALALQENQDAIHHIPKVLYHWRCHEASTAENPQSKLYAYEAGKRAIADYAERRGWKAQVEDTSHLGFYQLTYENNIFTTRSKLGAVGGRVLSKGKVAGGRMNAEGKVYYQGLSKRFSGYLHRAVLPQSAVAVDLRNIQIRKECHELFQEVVGVPYQTKSDGSTFDVATLPKDADYMTLSLNLCKALREAGYEILYLPMSGE